MKLILGLLILLAGLKLSYSHCECECSTCAGRDAWRARNEGMFRLIDNWVNTTHKKDIAGYKHPSKHELAKTRSKLPRLPKRIKIEYFMYKGDSMKKIDCERLDGRLSLYHKDTGPVIYITGTRSKHEPERLPSTLVRTVIPRRNVIHAAYVDGTAKMARVRDAAIAVSHFINCLHKKQGMPLYDIHFVTSPYAREIGNIIYKNKNWLR